MSELCEHETFKDICGICFRDAKFTALRAENERLRSGLRQALGWIDAWDCSFKNDPEWEEYSPQIRALLTPAHEKEDHQ